MPRPFFSLAHAAALVPVLSIVAAGCAGSDAAPTAPSAPPVVAEALAPGVGLKASTPGLVAPTGGLRTDTLTPEFVAGRATALHLTDSPAFEYRFEVQTPAGQVVANSDKVVPGSDGQVRWTLPTALALDSPYRWRVRAELGDRPGPWSEFGSFVSLDYRGLNPRPANGAWPSTGPAVVAYVADVWSDYLEPTSSLGQRIEHMEFIRDRVIEAGICGGLDLAWNLKRGVGPHSHDAIAWRKPNGFVEVVDIANAFDDNKIYMGLHWAIVAGPSGYDRYTNHPGC